MWAEDEQVNGAGLDGFGRILEESWMSQVNDAWTDLGRWPWTELDGSWRKAGWTDHRRWPWTDQNKNMSGLLGNLRECTLNRKEK